MNIFADKIDVTEKRNSVVSVITQIAPESFENNKFGKAQLPLLETPENIKHKYNWRNMIQLPRKETNASGSPKLTAFEKHKNKNLLYKKILLTKQKKHNKKFNLTIMNSKCGDNTTNSSNVSHSAINKTTIKAKTYSSKPRITTFTHLKCHYSNLQLQKIEGRTRYCPFSSIKSSFAGDSHNIDSSNSNNVKDIASMNVIKTPITYILNTNDPRNEMKLKLLVKK